MELNKLLIYKARQRIAPQSLIFLYTPDVVKLKINTCSNYLQINAFLSAEHKSFGLRTTSEISRI